MGHILIHLGASNDSFLWKSNEVSKCTSQAYLRNKILLLSLKLWGQTESIFLCWFWKAYKLLIVCSTVIFLYIYVCEPHIPQTQGMKIMGWKSVNLEHLLYVTDIPMRSPKSHIEITPQLWPSVWNCNRKMWFLRGRHRAALWVLALLLKWLISPWASGAHHCLSHCQAVVPGGADCQLKEYAQLPAGVTG